MRLSRRGFSLTELLISLVMMGIVGGAMMKLLTGMQRISRSQAEQVELQSNVRTGALVVPAEMREMGYDVDDLGNVFDTDLVAMAADRVQFRAMRGIGFICAFSGAGGFVTDVWIRRPFYGVRDPQLTDGYRLFVEQDFNLGADDRWVNLVPTNVDLASNCGADPAIRLTFPVPVLPGTASQVPVTAVFVGAPIRTFEVMEFGLFAQGGRSWLGARSVSIGEVNFQPVVGPLENGTGFGLSYRAADNTVVPVTGNPANVRTIQVTLNGETDPPIALAGQGKARTEKWSLSTRVALRNAQRP